MRLLLVEDDVVIASQIADILERNGFHVDTRPDGEAGLDAAEEREYGLVILDVMLPKKSGWDVCRELRLRRTRSPILMLTARDSVEDRVRGLEEGADDYLVKPFDGRELIARVRALLRREQTVRTGIIRIGDLEIDTAGHRVTRAGQELHLTPREYSLLEALAKNAGRTLTREVILDRIWEADEALGNTVNFHVTSLRKKVDSGFETKLIHTVHGFGYVLRPPEAL